MQYIFRGPFYPLHEHGPRGRRRKSDSPLPLRRISDQVYRGAFDGIIPIPNTYLHTLLFNNNIFA